MSEKRTRPKFKIQTSLFSKNYPSSPKPSSKSHKTTKSPTHPNTQLPIQKKLFRLRLNDNSVAQTVKPRTWSKFLVMTNPNERTTTSGNPLQEVPLVKPPQRMIWTLNSLSQHLLALIKVLRRAGLLVLGRLAGGGRVGGLHVRLLVGFFGLASLHLLRLRLIGLGDFM